MSRRQGGIRSSALLAILLLLGHGGAARAAQRSAAAEADSLYRRAIQRFATPSADSRRAALADFEEASRLSPDRPDIWISYGEACLETGRFQTSRSCLSRVGKLLPRQADSWLRLGHAWKHDWLASMEHSSLEEALDCFVRACAADSERAQSWSAVSALELLLGHPREALGAALRARRADPDAAEPLLVLGASLYRLSVLAYADSAFRVARGRLPEALLARFDGDPAAEARQPAAGDSSAVAAPQAPFPWPGSDPDLTTPENEAQLDYLTRLTLALFLFREGDEIRWDKRAELFLRYGPPSSVEYDPAGAQLGGKELEFVYRQIVNSRGAPPNSYPYNMQVWHYEDLGMDVTLWDRFLIQNYQLPYSKVAAQEPVPDPATLAAHPELVALAGGRGVYRAMAPGARPMAVSGSVTRFPLADGSRLLAHVFAAGGPADSLWGTWAVVTAEGRVVARGSHALAISACDPTHTQVGDFAATVPPGEYRLDLSVRAAGGRRGVAHLRASVGPLAARLTMSDLVLLCSDRATTVDAGGVRIEPNTSGHVSRARTLTVYYELEHLATGADGTGRFSYSYSVHPVDEDGAQGAAVFEATREEENVGAHRRQFVSVPIKSIAPGDYELRLEVRDLVAGTTVRGVMRFVKD